MAGRFFLPGLVAVAVAGSPRPLSGDPVPPSGQVEPEPERPGIHIDSIDRGEDRKSAWLRIQAVSDTPVRESWEVLRDIEHWARVMDLISRVEVLGEEEGETLYRLSISPPWPLSDYFSIVRVRESDKERTISYRVDQGFLFATSGRILVGETPHGCWMRFENQGLPERRFPDWMVKIGVHLVLPSVLNDLRRNILEVARQRRDRGSAPYP